jgi:tRNA(Ile)-lysidine synthetase-like protein
MDRDSQSLRHWLGRLAEASGAVPRPQPVTEEILRELHRQWTRETRRLRVPVGPGAWLERRKNTFYWEIGEHVASAGGGGEKECSRPVQRVILDNGRASAAWRWGDRRYTMTVRTYPRPAVLRFPASREGRAIFDADRISCTLLVRTRKDGDRFSPLGVRSESRKLKVFLNEQKIPAGIRDNLPLVFAGSTPAGPGGPEAVAGETLAWVPGLGISEYYKVGDETSTILEMEMTCPNP